MSMLGLKRLLTGWQWIRQHLSWPLALALLLSLSVHVLLLSEVHWSLWGKDSVKSTLIEARLQAPSAKTRPQDVQSTQLRKPAKQPQTKTPPLAPHSAPQADNAAVQSAAGESAVMENSAVENAPQTASEAVTETAVDSTDSQAENAVADAPEEGLPTPYQRVETAFELYLNGEKRPSGTALIYYQAEADSYRLKWEIEGSGLLKLFYPKLVQESQGAIGEHGLRPAYYRYAFGSRADKTFEATFDWQDRVIRLNSSKGETRQDLPNHTQDLLSFMYQFMFVPPLQEMRVSLTNGKRLGEYEYSFEGEETLTLAGNPIQTVHVSHSRGETDEKVELWLASDYRYVPVKIKKTEKNGMVIEQIATRLNAQ